MSTCQESYTEKMLQHVQERKQIIEAAAGRRPANLVFKNASYVNVFTNRICKGDIAVSNGFIVGIGNYTGKEEIDASGELIAPGFIDAHIHLESSLVAPSEFVKAILPHGTTTVVTDPHEIANVMGTDGIEYMLQATAGLPVDVKFMLPSCVPATPKDESGAELDYYHIAPFYGHPRVLGLAEMMNYVGTVNADDSIVDKLVSAQVRQKVIDGHAPGLSGNALNAYIAAGIQSDHECSSLENAVAKIERGQYIMIREGTAAKNLDALMPLLSLPYADRCLFCCDDKHPSDLLEVGHIDYHIKRCIANGVDPILAIKAASCNAARYFKMDHLGAIAPGYLADMVVIDDFQNFTIKRVYKRGALVSESGRVTNCEIPSVKPELTYQAHHTFHVSPLCADDFCTSSPKGVIGIVPGEIISLNKGFAEKIDVKADVLKVAVIERHKNTGHVGVGYIHGYGLTSGAVATSISHDSHNIIVVGTNEADMAAAANRVIANEGGIVVTQDGQVIREVILSIAGIMSDDSLENVNRDLEAAKEAAYQLGVNRGIDPFMTLSFMALPVIPELRITTKGVLDVDSQSLVSFQ